MGNTAAYVEERNEMERKLFKEMSEAESRCRSTRENDQCRAAYFKLIQQHDDIIGQRHGFPPLTWHKREQSNG